MDSLEGLTINSDLSKGGFGQDTFFPKDSPKGRSIRTNLDCRITCEISFQTLALHCQRPATSSKLYWVHNVLRFSFDCKRQQDSRLLSTNEQKASSFDCLHLTVYTRLDDPERPNSVTKSNTQTCRCFARRLLSDIESVSRRGARIFTSWCRKASNSAKAIKQRELLWIGKTKNFQFFSNVFFRLSKSMMRTKISTGECNHANRTEGWYT